MGSMDTFYDSSSIYSIQCRVDYLFSATDGIGLILITAQNRDNKILLAGSVLLSLFTAVEKQNQNTAAFLII